MTGTPLGVSEEEIQENVVTLTKALLDSYEDGFDTAFSVIIAGLKASLEKGSELPEAQSLLSGLETAIYFVEGLKEKFVELNTTNNPYTNTVETNQGDTNHG